MAYLNVRERKMETRIAYVGPFGVGKAKNLEQLGLRATPKARATSRQKHGDGEVLSLAWESETSFRDFPISVEVVAPCDGTPERTTALVRDADAIVLVLDASPDAGPRNRALVDLVREALVSDKVPVVVQVNKTDVAQSRMPATIVEELGIGWPHLAASATRGEGVVETLARTIEGLLVSLEELPVDGPRESAEVGAKTPLLAALKDVLADAISRHAASVEGGFTARLDERLARAHAEALATLGKVVADESTKTHAAITKLRERTEAMEAVARELSARVANGTDDTLRGLATHATALAAHAGALSALEEKVGDARVLERAIEAVRVASLRQHDELSAKLDRQNEELRTELGRAIESRARTDRELVLSSIAGLKGAIEGLSIDVKAHDVRLGVTDLNRLVGEMRTKVDAMVPVLAAVKDVQRALRDEVGTAIVARVAKVEDLVRSLAEATSEADTKSEVRATEIGERVKEIGVAMKAKKSWFT